MLLILLFINESCKNNSLEKLENSILFLHLKLNQQNKKIAKEILQSKINIEFYYVNDKFRRKVHLDAMRELDLETNKLIHQIDKISKEIINLSDLGIENINSEYGDTIQIKLITNKQETDLVASYFKGEYSDKISKFKELEDYINSFVKNVNIITERIYKYERLNPEYYNNFNLDIGEFKNDNFINLPLISVITILEELKHRIYMSELRILKRFDFWIASYGVSFDNLEPRIINNELIMAGWRSTVPFIVHIGSYDDLDKENGCFYPNADKLIFETKDGKLKLDYRMINKKFSKYSILLGCKQTIKGVTYFYPVMNNDKYYFESK